MPYVENLGSGGGTLDAQYGSAPGANTNAPLLLDPTATGPFVYTPGTAGNYVSVPHSPSLNILGTQGTPFLSLPGEANTLARTPNVAALQITGDVEIVARVYSPQWQSTATEWICGNRDNLATVGGFLVSTFTGAPFMSWVDAATNTSRSFLSASKIPSGAARYWLRFRLDFDAGAPNGHTVTYAYHADQPTEPSPTSPGWISVGSGNAGAASAGIAPAANNFEIGKSPFSTSANAHDNYRVIVRNGIAGTTVFDADFTQQALGSRGFIESTGKLVSLVGNAAQIVDGTTYGFLPGVNGSYFSAPDSAALSITGDLDIRVRVSPSSLTATYAFASKQQTNAGGYEFAMTGGFLRFTWATGAATLVRFPTNTLAAAGLVAGQTYWLRAQLDVDNGAGGAQVSFFWAPDSETEPTVWTAFAQPAAEGATTVIGDSTENLGIGAYHNGGAIPLAGRVYRVIIRPNLTAGTKAFDADFTRQLQFNPSRALAGQTFTEGSPNLATVTANGVARVERDRDLEIVARVSLDDWTPASETYLVSKYNTVGNLRSYALSVPADGRLAFRYATNGVTAVYAQTSVVPSFTNGIAYWLRVTFDVRDGATNVVRFYSAPDAPTEPTSWTQIGSDVAVTGAASIFPSTANVTISGINDGGSAPFAGKVYETIVRNGIDGPAVLDLDFGDTITSGSEVYLPDTVDEVIPEAEQYLPNLGWGGAALNARFGSAVTADTNDPLLLTHTGTNYLYLPGVTGNYASMPSAAGSPTDITGDIDISVRVALDNWGVSGQSLVSKGYGNSYWFYLEATQIILSPNLSGGNVYPVVTWTSRPTSGTAAWLRATRVASTGVVSYYFAVDSDSEPTAWSLIGSVTSTSGNIVSSSQPVGVGAAAQTGVAYAVATGKFFRAIIRNGIGGTVVFDANFTTGITSGAQTTFTESSSNAATVTINRSTSGRKSVAVVQDVLLFGTDDYLEVPDNDLLDFGATDSFTVMAAVRQWGTPANFGRYIDKASNLSGLGWGISSVGTTYASRGLLYDAGGDFAVADSSVSANGAATTLGLMVERSTQSLVAFNGTSLSSPSATTNVDSLVNSFAMKVGSFGAATTNFQDMEFRGSAIWRRALTTAELALVDAHYTTGPTAASTALMQQAVWWIDAGTRSVAQINRSTSGRKTVACSDCVWLLGTDDYFEIADGQGLLDFGQGDDFSLLVIARSWWAQGTSDTLLAKTGTTLASAQGYALANGSSDGFTTAGRLGDGVTGATADASLRPVGTRQAVLLVRDTNLDTLTAYRNLIAGTPVTDPTTGTSANTSVVRIGRLSDIGAEYLDAEIQAAAVWRRKLSTAEIAAVLNYYGVG